MRVSEVVSPSNNAELSSYPVVIKLEFPEGSSDKQFSANLNGLDVTHLFTPLRNGTRSAILYRRNINLGGNSFTASDGASVAKVHFTFRQPAGVPGSSSQSLGNYVSIQTRSIQGNGSQLSDYGITIGSTTQWAPNTTYLDLTANGPDGLTGFQVLLVDRATGSVVSNTSFGTAVELGAEIFEFLLEDSSFYSGCGEFGCLVFIQDFQASTVNGYQPRVAAAPVEAGGSALLDTYPTTTYSLISSVSPVGGAPQFSGYESILAKESAAISGVLIPDNFNAYSFASPSRVTFSTGTAPSSTSNTVTIGSTKYTSATVPAGQGGLHVVEVDRKSLVLLAEATYTPINAGQLGTFHGLFKNFQAACPPAGDSCPCSSFRPWEPSANPPIPRGKWSGIRLHRT